MNSPKNVPKYLLLTITAIVVGLCAFQFSLRVKPGLLEYAEASGKLRPVKTKEDWQKKRNQILDGMQLAMGKLPESKSLPTPEIEVLQSEKLNGFTRQKIRFLGAPNEYVHALLYMPDPVKPNEKFPAMLVLHGTGEKGKWLVDSSQANQNRAVATELAYRRYVVIAPDYPSFGDLTDHNFDTDRYESGTMQAIFNHIRCIDLLQSLKQTHSDKIGVIGHSLGGHNAMFVGAFDTRLKVIVASCGWTPFAYYNAGKAVTERFGGALGAWAQDRYMPLLRDKFKLNHELFPFDFDEIISTLAPRTFFTNSPINDSNFNVEGVKTGIKAASEVYKFLNAENNLIARYPDAQHDFPEAARFEAYEVIDRILKP